MPGILSLGLLPGSTITNPFRLFKDPSLAMLPRGAEVRSRYDLDLSEYDPSLYSSNIEAERNQSPELEAIKKSKDGKKYREYQDETKRLMKEADEKRKEKNKEKNKKEEKDIIVTASNKNVNKDEQINKSIAYRPEYQELQRAKKDTFGFLFDNKKDEKEDNATEKLAQQKIEKQLSRTNQLEYVVTPDGIKGSGVLVGGELYKPGEKLSVNQRVAIQGKIMMSGEDSVDPQLLKDFYNSGGPVSREESKKNQKSTKKSDFFGFNEGGPVFDNDDDTSNNDVDSVPAVLTPGEFVVTKDAVEKVGVDTLEGLNASVGATNKASNLGSFSIANDIQDIEISNGGLEETNYTSKTDVESKIDPLFDDLSDSINASVKGYNQGGLVEGVKKMYSSEIEENKSKNNLKPLLDMIGSGESDNVGGYSAMFPSESYPEMLDMSINELIEFQKEKLKDGRKSVAVGRYQMLYPEDYAAAAGLPLTAKFTPDNQDKMVIAYLKKNRKLNEFLNNEITNEQFSEELSQEFGTFKSASGFVLPNNTGSIDFPMMVPVFNKIKNNLKPIDRPSNNFQSSIENKDVSQILATINTDPRIQILPPISTPQNNQIKDNSPVMAQPSQTPQPSTKELVDTKSPVNFINLISNRSLSV
jgi:muramidase (phage lysozyme)